MVYEFLAGIPVKQGETKTLSIPKNPKLHIFFNFKNLLDDEEEIAKS